MTKLSTIFLDLDGVLCDLVTPAMYAHGRQDLLQPGAWPKGVYSIETVLGITQEHFWDVIHEFGADFWAGIPPYEWMQDLVTTAELAASEVVLLSKPTSNHYSTAGKHRWIKRHFGDDFRSYILTPQKHHLAGPGRLLVDDCASNISEWQACGGDGLLFPQPWNHGEGGIDTVLDALTQYRFAATDPPAGGH